MISIWCDFVERSFLQNEFKGLVQQGLIKGATSNPNIFAEALKNPSYAETIIRLKSESKSPKEIYEIIALEDIKQASNILYPMYQENPQNGLISIEIDPFLSYDIEASIDEGVRLWRELDSKNAMIKVPATESGYTIMENLMLRGININATLVFTKEQAQKALQAFKSANTQAQGVISIFVSRFDRELDSKLPLSLQGKYGIANAIDIFRDFQTQNNNENYRILFASTGVKQQNEIYNDIGYYVYPLAFDTCVNTLPLSTLKGVDYARLEKADKFEYENILQDVRACVDIAALEDKLLKDGLKMFEESFRNMLYSLQPS